MHQPHCVDVANESSISIVMCDIGPDNLRWRATIDSTSIVNRGSKLSVSVRSHDTVVSLDFRGA